MFLRRTGQIEANLIFLFSTVLTHHSLHVFFAVKDAQLIVMQTPPFVDNDLGHQRSVFVISF